MTVAGHRRSEAVVYPDTDHMGQHEIQVFITGLLRPLIERLLRERGTVAHVSADTFIYWVEGEPKTTIAPDLYVLPNVEQDVRVPCWKLWELDGVKPSFALEIASTNWKKDYDQAPALYAAMGCEELVIYDPHANERSRRRVRWQRYKRDARGAFRKVAVRGGDRVWVASLGVWLREIAGPRGLTSLRVGLGDLGNELLPTADEAREAEAAARLAAEAQARTAAEEITRLRAEIAALRAAAAPRPPAR